MEKEEKGLTNVYKIDTEEKINKFKIFLVVSVVILVILLYLVLLNTIKIAKSKKVYKQYANQLITLQEKEEERRAKEEAEEEKRKQERTPNLTEEGRENIKHLYSSENKIAYLTFDDGPSEVTTNILDTLKQENIKATFFVLGNNVNLYPDYLKRIYEEGHFIGNHGYTHVYSSIYSSPEAVLDEFNRCNDAVKNVIGNPEYNSHLFRFPGGLVGGKYAAIKEQAKILLNENNIVNVDWNALNGDAETNDLSSEFELQRLRETTDNKNVVVILMHDAPLKKVTAETLPQIIAYLREQGYEFRTFYDIIK